MVKSYLRYSREATFGVIASSGSNAVFDASGKYAVAPALEEVLVWNLKQGEVVARWREDGDQDQKAAAAEVTAICRAPTNIAATKTNTTGTTTTNASEDRFAVGYADGTVRIWSMREQQQPCLVTFRGHRGAVTALAYDKSGTKLVSGSKDTDLIVWDIVSEVGLFRYVVLVSPLPPPLNSSYYYTTLHFTTLPPPTTDSTDTRIKSPASTSSMRTTTTTKATTTPTTATTTNPRTSSPPPRIRC